MRKWIITVEEIASSPPQPGRITLATKRATNVATKFGLKFTLPPVGASDVGSRELTVVPNNGAPVVTLLNGQPTITDEMVFDSDSQISVTLVDIDTHGNRSVPSVPFTYTVTDDVPPPQPGVLGVTEKRQIEVLPAP